MEVRIGVSAAPESDSITEIRSLMQWLRSEDDLSGTDLRIDGDVQPGQMGLDAETINAVLGSAGSGAALITALGAWLSSRRRVKIRVEGPEGVVEIESKMADENYSEVLQELGRMTGLAAGDATS